MEQRVTIIGLGVKDLKAASDFYENKFGWKKMKSSNNDIVFFQLNGLLLSLYPSDKLAEDAHVSAEGEGFKKFTLAYNTKTKHEVDELFNALEGRGVKVVKKPEEVFWGGYSGYVADLDDNLWEIAFNPFLPLDDCGNTIEE
ncbi:VOC family protein [Seonamhaeicola sp. MEBiC1930]|uniref:VOC family protein n=1 Tax=Seonamhaeicola sp. MEBiC01930 TaxID=2976768 RepID=UPI00325192BE